MGLLTKLQRSNLIIFLVTALRLNFKSISLIYIFKCLQYIFLKTHTQRPKLLCGIRVWNLCMTGKNSQVLYLGKWEYQIKRISAYMDRTLKRFGLYIGEGQVCKYCRNQQNHLNFMYLKTVKQVKKIHKKCNFKKF